MTQRPLWVWGAAAALTAFAADQATKWLIVHVVMDPPRLIPVMPSFNLTLGLNRGVSFGMLRDTLGDTPWVMIVLGFGIVAMLGVWLRRAGGRLEAAGLGAIIGGALGNIIDRARLGGVVDFLDFYVGAWHWPTFNVADIAISVGVACVLLGALLESRQKAGRSA
jgi:signal peptidase II